MTDATQPPYDHDREKLRNMALANRTEIEAIKALQLAGKHVDRWRVFKLQRAVKAQAKFEQELRRRAEKIGEPKVLSGCAVRAAIQEEQAREDSQ